jgi:hypothetical protein
MTELQARIEVLRAAPGDVIVASVDQRLTAEQHTRIQEWMRRALPPHFRVMVLDSSIRLSHVVHAEPEPVPREEPLFDFDAWMRERAERAHREFMERISRRLPCDWSTEDIARYMGAPLD